MREFFVLGISETLAYWETVWISIEYYAIGALGAFLGMPSHGDIAFLPKVNPYGIELYML